MGRSLPSGVRMRSYRKSVAGPPTYIFTKVIGEKRVELLSSEPAMDVALRSRNWYVLAVGADVWTGKTLAGPLSLQEAERVAGL